MKQGMNSSDIRRKNRGLFLKNIALEKANSRVELAKITGLAKMTAGNIVQELIEKKLVEELHPVANDNVGPNPQRLEISKSAAKIVGVYLHRDGIAVSIGDLNGNISKIFEQIFENETVNTVTEKLISSVKNAISFLGEMPCAIGVAAIGPLTKDGTIINSTNFFGIETLPVKKILSENFGVPVAVYNDMDAAAIAELYKGKTECTSFSYVGIANGIGAGIIIDEKLLSSNESFCGELGHMSIDYNGNACPCGNKGCLETYVRTSIIEKSISDVLGKNVKISELKDFCDIPAVDGLMCEYCKKMAVALTGFINLVKPQAIIIGHDGFYFPDKYLKNIEKQINNAMLGRNMSYISVKKSVYEHKTPVYGSICVAMMEIFDGKIIL